MGLCDLGNGIYRLGESSKPSLYPSFSYLITSGGKGVLIDPGSREDFAENQKNIRSVISLKNISYIILTSEVPEVCSSLPLWDSGGFEGTVILHWKAFVSFLHYGANQNYSTIRTKYAKIPFGKNRVIFMYNMPGIPTPGSLCCYDSDTKSLFSGMLFGSFGGNPQDADEESWGRIDAFHDQFFSHLYPESDTYTQLKKMSIDRILPRTGPVICKYTQEAVQLLGKNAASSKGTVIPDSFYPDLISKINNRLVDLFSEKEVRDLLKEMHIQFTESLTPVLSEEAPRATFEHYVHELHRIKGILWLSMIKTMIEKALEYYNESPPRIFTLYENEIAMGLGNLVQEVQKLKSENFELQKSIIEASDDQLKDTVTGLYNELFFEEYIEALQPTSEDLDSAGNTVILFRLDKIIQLNQTFGSKAGDSTLKGLASFLQDRKRENAVLFRMNGPVFACIMQNEAKDSAIHYAETLQKQAEESDQFIDKISVSAAIISFEEIRESIGENGRFFQGLIKVGKERLKLLTKLGPGSICSESTVSLRRSSGIVLLIENNRFEADLLERILEREGFETHSVTNGSEAIEKADFHRPDVIVSEIFIPQMDGFQIRKNLLASSDLKNIPFILISRQKSDDSVQRAHELGIHHFFQKPVMAKEIGGIIKMLVEEAVGGHR